MARGDRPTFVPVSTSTTSQLWSLNFGPAAVVPSQAEMTLDRAVQATVRRR